MKYNTFGNTDMEVSKITLGSWVMGGGEWWGSDHDDSRYIRVINKAIDAGINLIDTASGYGGGHSEVVVGKALKGQREKVFVATKATGNELKKGNAEKTVTDSLNRLGMDYVDVFFIHWAIPGIDIRENMQQLEKLREKGLIRYIGASNLTLQHFELAKQAGKIDIYQPPYSLLYRNIEQEVLPYCIKEDIAVMTYSALCMGLLTGKYHQDWAFEKGDIRPDMVPLFQGDTFIQSIEAVNNLKTIAEKYDATIAQCAINWVFSQQGIDTAIMGARTEDQLDNNLKAIALEMSQHDLEKMSQICFDVSESVKDWDTMYHKDEPNFEIKP
jgi:myo-inositol catabolism protein IolS